MQYVDLNSVIEDVLGLIENDPRKTETITIKNLVTHNVVVMFAPDHLRQILINLMINSLEVLDGKGEIAFALEKSETLEDTYIRMVVSDTGPGFPEDSLGKMFEPFFSTKKEGTGLGLAIVRKMVIQNNGRVFARNRIDGGAEVVLDLLLKGED